MLCCGHPSASTEKLLALLETIHIRFQTRHKPGTNNFQIVLLTDPNLSAPMLLPECSLLQGPKGVKYALESNTTF
jgi:hypothetical protein